MALAVDHEDVFPAPAPKRQRLEPHAPTAPRTGSRLFVPFRTIGLVSPTPVPFSLAALGKTTWQVTTSVGRSFQTYDLRRGLQLVFLSRPQCPDKITAICAHRDRVLVAWGGANGFQGEVGVFKRGQLQALLEPVGTVQQVDQLVVFGPWIVGCGKKALEVWKHDTLEHYTTISAQSGAVRGASSSFTGRICTMPTYLNKVFVACTDGSVAIYNVRTAKLVIISLKSKHGKAVTSIAFRSDGLGAGQDGRSDGVMATASAQDGDITFWDLNKGGRVAGVLRNAHDISNTASHSGIAKIEFLPGQHVLVSSGLDNALKSWIFDQQPFSPVPRPLHSRSGHGGPVTELAFLPAASDGSEASGKWLLSAGQDRSLWAFSLRKDGQNTELSQGEIKHKAKKMGKLADGHSSIEELKAPPIVSMACCLNRDGGMGAVTGRPWTNEGSASAEESSKTGWESIVTAHVDDPLARTWSWGRRKAGRWAFQSGDNTPVTSVAISPCGTFAIIGSKGGAIDMFNLQSGAHRQRFPPRLKPGLAKDLKAKLEENPDLLGTIRGHSDAITGLVVDTLNHTLVSTSLDGTVIFWDFATGQIAKRLRLPSTAALRVKYNPVSNLLGLSCDDLCVRIVDIESYRIVRQLWGCVGQINDLSFSNDGRWMVTCSMDSAVRVFDLATGNLIDAFKTATCTNVAFSPTGEYLATTHAGALGINIWTNKSLYTHIPIRGIDEEKDMIDLTATVHFEPTSELALAKDGTDGEDNVDPIELGSTIDQLDASLLTLSLLPRSRWQTLLNLENIRQRNKPIQPPEKPKAAPFFLGSSLAISSNLNPGQPADHHGERRIATIADVHSIPSADTELERQISSILNSNDPPTPRSVSTVVQHLISLPPSATDLFIRSISLSELPAFINILTSHLRMQRDYELVNTWMAVVLKVHSEYILEVDGVREAVEEWRRVNEEESRRLDAMVGYVSGVVDALYAQHLETHPHQANMKEEEGTSLDQNTQTCLPLLGPLPSMTRGAVLKPPPARSSTLEDPQGPVMASNPLRRPGVRFSAIEFAPPTPPEELDYFSWTTAVLCPSQGSRTSSTGSQAGACIQSTSAPTQPLPAPARPSAISLPVMGRMTDADEASPPSWLDSAANTIVASQAQPLSSGYIQMVVQALPSQRKGSRSKPIFQQLAQLLQQQSQEAPYITITHVVSSLLSMGDVPASPPATPNQLNTTDSYFDSQTIFTHAATGPIYHPPTQSSIESLPRVTGIVAAPASVNVSTLERYIPPTTGEEVLDFFTLSRKSYLVDRMTELSPKNGTLLLVYPTANGARTFANRYIGPIIEPFLRRFCLLNNLSMDAASRMGRVAAIPAMMTFEEMCRRLEQLCTDLAERAPVGREPRSGYSLIHSAKVDMTVDRNSWLQWFVEQESARLRQDLVDYQRAGGRISTRGFDTTPASLAREVIEGIRTSTEVAGGVGIELGVFIIRRSMIYVGLVKIRFFQTHLINPEAVIMFPRLSILIAVLVSNLVAVRAIPTISITGSKFFTSNGTQWFIKGIAYQLSEDDPLVDTDQCQLDANLMKELGANAIRVYHVDSTADHDGCMTAFADAGIYAFIDLDTFSTYIRIGKKISWTEDQFDAYKAVMDTFQKYDNVAGFYVGNEVLNTLNESAAAPYLLKAAADLKTYRDAQGYRNIPIGYSATDTTVLRPMLQDYVVCRPNTTERLDFYSLNSYEWCGSTPTYESSGYVNLQAAAEGYPVPIFFSEDGCNTVPPRTFSDQAAIFGSKMVDTWSGVIIYEWIQEENNYGLISYGSNDTSTDSEGSTVVSVVRSGTPTPVQPDFSNLQSQWAAITPIGVLSSEYAATFTTTAPECPSSTSGGWTVDPSAALPTEYNNWCRKYNFCQRKRNLIWRCRRRSTWASTVPAKRIAITSPTLGMQLEKVEALLTGFNIDRKDDPTPSDDMTPNDATIDGTWGEREVGERVSREHAMHDFDDMNQQLAQLGLQQTRSQQPTRTRPGGGTLKSHTASDIDSDGNEVDLQYSSDDEGDFHLGDFLKDGHFEKRTPEGNAAKKVGVVWKNLTVKGTGATLKYTKTLPQAVLGTFGPDLYHLITRFAPALRLGKPPPTRNLIRDFTGMVRAGEIMLILGRPGSGCSTFLKAIANNRETYVSVEGDVRYGGITAADQKKYYKGEVNYNPEDDQHLPTLNVWQTMRFALMNKTKRNEKASIPMIANTLLKMFGILHTKYTLVDNVSGGERKRVGIAETLATKSSVICWDNSTRGLDASTALDYARSLRVMTDISNRTTLVTLYQAGEEIYELVDKTLVIEDGRMIYQGPADKARQYFIDLGFHCPERQTTADFLTSVADRNERQFRDGMEASTPKTAEELEAAFRASDLFQQTVMDIELYEMELEKSDCADTRQFQAAVKASKSNSRLMPNQSSYTVSFWHQVLACTQREFWLMWGDKESLYTKGFIIISNGLIVGSLFYGESVDSNGAFPRGGALFFGILFLGWLQLGELVRAVSGRSVIARHRDYAFYRPSAVVIARVILDIPTVLVQTVVLSLILYWMASMSADAGKFFIYMLFVYITTICITALYRMFAALSPTIDDAIRFAGLTLNLLILFVGYVIPKRALTSDVIWFGWIYYVNPISHAYEAVLTNEFSARTMQCSPEQLIPQGPGVDPLYQTCTLMGTPPGSRTITGEQYYSTFPYTRSHLWRNFGLLLAFTVLYVCITVLGAELFSFVRDEGGALIFKRTKKAKQVIDAERREGDEESGNSAPFSNDILQTSSAKQTNDDEKEVSRSRSVFTFEKITYEVTTSEGKQKLLNNISGFAKPGTMIALMGSSGAGKTTLLNTLAQRQKTGTVGGEMMVDGRPLGIEFQRGTGFCEQNDLHDKTATIREALEFSAILRQDRDIPRSEKIDYVNRIIDLLELNEIQDALIISLGVEQRKRLTIGVELGSKPELLLFLDEPTSGLDAQSAFSIVRFLRKLADSGQAIMCTIHQPSSMLIQQFDMILALKSGGTPFYFGPYGENGEAVVRYFADRGTVCPPSKNVAEFILETSAKGGKRGKDGKRRNWEQEWIDSEQNAAILAEIRHLKSTRAQVTTPKRHHNHRRSVHEYAATVWLQTYMLTKRTFVAYWRDPSYLYAKLFVSVVIGIFNGFTFFDLDNSLSSLQSRLFTTFLILMIPPTIVNGVIPKFYASRDLWEKRELPSRTYGWFAFCTAQVVAEIPISIVSSVLYFLLWYYPTGLPRDSATAGYVFLMTLFWFLFQSSWGQWICAFAPSFSVLSNILPLFFVMVSLFNGVVRPYADIPAFWRYWMYWINPSTWWINGVLAAVLADFAIECKPAEVSVFNPPPGQTCLGYAGDYWLQGGGSSSSSSAPLHRGYLINPNATTACGYCAYRTGEEYLQTINVRPADKWTDCGIFAVFVCANWALVYFFIYFVRVKRWTFGMRYLFGWFDRLFHKTRQQTKGDKEETKNKGNSEELKT
ncbi:hypothetical protein DV735_g4954, partial [Chaetothyriales sp. CBS 134920]